MNLRRQLLDLSRVLRSDVGRGSRVAHGLLVVCLAGCALHPQPQTGDALRNLTYRGIYDHPVTLNNGVFDGAPFVSGGASRPRVELAPEPRVSDDLDGDGVEDMAVLLTETGGGTGVNTHLAVVARRGGGAENIATRLIGDRVQVRSLAFRDEALVLELVATGPDEPACCPTQKLRKTYRLRNDSLIETASEALGQVGVRDLEGTTWILTHLGRQEPVPEGMRITAIFKDGRASGSAGCNGYFGGISGEGPRNLQVGPLGTTKMACPETVMEVEGRYLGALQRVTEFSFLLGRLALMYGEKEMHDALLFAP